MNHRLTTSSGTPFEQILQMLTAFNQLPLPKGTQPPPQFSAHVYCSQTAGWINMSLGTEVNLGPGDVVLDGVAAPTPQKGAHPAVFGPCLLWPNGWIDQDATWCGSRPRPRPHCVRRDPAPPPLFSTHVYCGHGRPSQLLLSSCILLSLSPHL